MSNQSITYQVNLKVVGEDIVGQVTAQIEQMTEQTRKATKTFGDCFKALWSFRLVADEINNLKQSFDNLLIPGKDLNANMLELSAITGVTGEGLKSIEKAARDTAKTFGTSAVDNVESYKMMLSQLSPEIAKNAEAMKLMGENVNILSKQMGGDTIAATDVLNTSLNQFGVSMEDPIAAAKVMTDMMNVMSAAAQNGSAELPQIKQALEQVGMVAKTTGLSFAETNAYIQLLDQAGKKGSEGGVALRNVLTTLSEGRFTSKLAADGLKEAGISVDYLADSSIPLHERLKTLRKIQGDTALMTKVFGKENMAAAIAMINTADEAQAMSKVIEGTNSAVEQANVIMENSAEKNARLKAQVEDFKISLFNASNGWIGYAGAVGGVVQEISGLLPIFSGLKNMVTGAFSAINLLTDAKKREALWTNILAVKTKIWAGATKIMTIAQTALNAVMSANPIGLIIAGIVLLIGYIATAISYFDSFGSTMLMLLGPIGMLISAFMLIKRHWDSIVEAFKSEGIIGGLKRIGIVLLDVLMHPLQRILGWVAELTDWDWAKSAAGSVEEFRGKMNLITDEEKNKETSSQTPLTEKAFSLEKLSQPQSPKTPTIGGVAATSQNSKIGNSDKSSGGGGKVQSLNINTLIGNLTIQTTNLKESKQQIVEQVKEVLLTAVADFSTT